jgi:hypothetical protein
MGAEVVKFVDSLDAVKTVSKRVADKSGKVSEVVEINCARVVTNEGRKGIAVANSGSHVVVRYTDCLPGDVEGMRCIERGEQRQHYATELTVYSVDPNPLQEE